MTDLREANVRLLRQVYDGIEGRSVEPIGVALHSDVELHVNMGIYHFADGLISEIWITAWR